MKALGAIAIAGLWAAAAFGQPDGPPRVPELATGGIITAQDVIPDGWIILDGDIAVPADALWQRANYVTNLWPGGVVPFVFDGGVSAAQRAIAESAMDVWESAANVTFRPKELLDQNYLAIALSPGEFNISLGIGMVGGQQIVYISEWTMRIVTHELGHVLGFWHEQQRANRDDFIEIISENATDVEEAFNFTIIPGSRHYGPYDFGSIMHYNQCAFSICADCINDLENCRTMLIRDPDDRANWQFLIGMTQTPSEWDRRVLSFMYPEPNWRFVDTTATNLFENGTFLEPDRSVARGLNLVPTGGRLHILEPTTYEGPSIYSRAMTIIAPIGGVVLR